MENSRAALECFSDFSDFTSIKQSAISHHQLIPENILLLGNPLNPHIPLRSVEIDPFDFCNHQCDWCFTRPYRGHEKSDIRLLVERLRQFVHEGGVAIHFSGGGEPLLFRPMYEPDAALSGMTLCEYTCSLGLVTSLITNGLLLDRLPPLNALPNLGFIRVSLDATDADTHALRHRCSIKDFPRISSAINSLLKQRGELFSPAIGISVIVDPSESQFTTRSELRQLVQLTDKLPVDFVQVKHVHTKNKLEADKLMRQVYLILSEYDQGQTEFWVHRYQSASPAVQCRVTRVMEAWDAKVRRFPCCHLYGQIEFEREELHESASDREIFNCSSQVCRYANINQLLQNLAEGKEKLYSFDELLVRLRTNLTEFGFHPHRLYPSAPNLWTKESADDPGSSRY